MIGSLRGQLLRREDGEVLVEVAGVGYRVNVMPTTAVGLGEVGSEVFLHVLHHVREDAQVLYGFSSHEERACFEALLGAHGVGPSLALAILAVHPPGALARVLTDDDIAALCLVPGVGKKTAARLLVELKAKLDLGELGSEAPDPLTRAPGANGDDPRGDAREALLSLGYGPDEVTAALRAIPDNEDPSEILREALRHLAVS